MIITISSTKGSPGASSWALLLGAAWPDQQELRVVVEADPDGGVFATRYSLGADTGVAQLATSCRRESAPDHTCGRCLAEGLWLVPGPASRTTAASIWQSEASTVATALRSESRVWLIDVGRLSDSSPLWPVAEVADVNLLVTHNTDEALVAVPERVRDLRQSGSPSAVLVLGPEAGMRADLEDFTEADRMWMAPHVGELPSFVAKVIGGGRSRRHMAWRSAVAVAAGLAELRGVPSQASMR